MTPQFGKSPTLPTFALTEEEEGDEEDEDEYCPDRVMGLLLTNFKGDYHRHYAPMLMGLAKANTVGRVYDYCGHDKLERLAFDLVLTNSNKIDHQGRFLGQALYDPRISLINHSCDPNASLVFKHYTKVDNQKSKRMLIRPSVPQIQVKEVTELGVENCCLRAAVKLNRDIAAGEEIKISYNDPYKNLSHEWKQSYLYHRYSFHCGCPVCCPTDPPLPDSSTSSSLQSSCASSPSAASNVGDLLNIGGLDINCSKVVPHKLNADESGSKNSMEDHSSASRSRVVDYEHSRGGTSESTLGESLGPLFTAFTVTDMNTNSKHFQHPGGSSHGGDNKSKSKSKMKKFTSIFSPRGSFSRDT